MTVKSRIHGEALSVLAAIKAHGVDQFGRDALDPDSIGATAILAEDRAPFLALDDPLTERLKKVDGTLADLKSEAGEKWRKLGEVKEAVGKVDGELTTESPEFKALDQAGKDYGAIQDKITAAENVKATLIDNLVRSGQGIPQEVKGRGLDERYLESPAGQALIKAAGQRIVERDEYKRLLEIPNLESKNTKIGAVNIGEAFSRDETKALLTGNSPTSAGAFNQPNRLAYVPLPLRPLTLLDLITIGQTDSDNFEYVRMNSFTNNAGMIPEATTSAPIGGGATAITGGLKPESGMDWEIVKDTTSMVAHWMPATRKSLKNAGQLRTIIDSMLEWGLDAKLEQQVGAGDGVGENLLGLFNQNVNSIPAGPASKADKIHMGMTQVRLDFMEPTGNLINPLDWEDIRLSREDGTTGSYLFGPPATAGAETLWGKPVAISASAPQGSGMTGAFKTAQLLLEGGVQILVSDSHLDFFTRNIVAILAEIAAGFLVQFPSAFAEVNFAAA